MRAMKKIVLPAECSIPLLRACGQCTVGVIGGTCVCTDDLEVWGEFTPYVCPIAPELVKELHRLIADYAARFRLDEAATQRIIQAAKHQPASTIAESVGFFRDELKGTHAEPEPEVDARNPREIKSRRKVKS